MYLHVSCLGLPVQMLAYISKPLLTFFCKLYQCGFTNTKNVYVSNNNTVINIMSCKTKRQYLLTCKDNFCLLTLQLDTTFLDFQSSIELQRTLYYIHWRTLHLKMYNCCLFSVFASTLKSYPFHRRSWWCSCFFIFYISILNTNFWIC